MYPAKYGYHVDEHIFVLSGNILPDRMVWVHIYIYMYTYYVYIYIYIYTYIQRERERGKWFPLIKVNDSQLAESWFAA